MKKMKRIVALICAAVIALAVLISITACDASWWDMEPSGTAADTANTQAAANRLQANQPTPTDIEYSLERYNLTRRAYWVNGQREKANSLVCPVSKPLGYVILLTESGSVVGKFAVDGKVSSLNSFLTPDSEYYEYSAGERSTINKWLADVDGSYGENDNGIFFFTPDGKYVEWSGLYLYGDIPFEVAAPVLSYKEVD